MQRDDDRYDSTTKGVLIALAGAFLVMLVSLAVAVYNEMRTPW